MPRDHPENHHGVEFKDDWVVTDEDDGASLVARCRERGLVIALTALREDHFEPDEVVEFMLNRVRRAEG